jgi:hypothetical protein
VRPRRGWSWARAAPPGRCRPRPPVARPGCRGRHRR